MATLEAQEEFYAAHVLRLKDLAPVMISDAIFANVFCLVMLLVIRLINEVVHSLRLAANPKSSSRKYIESSDS